LHGDMTQAMRDRVMNKFRKSGLEFLVATDIAARGIDVDDVQVVFNYDLPYDGEDYIHRIGRTGRAGRSGRAITFVSGRELFQIRNIERYTNTRITRAKIPTAGEVEEARENVFLEKMRVMLKSGEFQKQEQLLGRLLEEGFSSTDIAAACLAQLQKSETAPPKPAPREVSNERPRGPSFRPGASREAQYENRPPRHERLRDPVPPRRESSPPPSPKIPSSVAPIPSKTEAPALVAPSVAPVPVKAVIPPANGTPRDPSPLPPVKPKASRATPADFTRLYLNLGVEHGLNPGDVVGAILGETGLPAKNVGVVDLRERHTFVDVASESANAILAKLNRAQIKGRKVKMKVA